MASSDLDKVVKLLLTQQIPELQERHLAAIDNLCKNNAAGFTVRDLPRVAQILQITLQLISKGATQFVGPICSLIRTLAKPYRKQSITDELLLSDVWVGVLQTLAHGLQDGMPQQLQACTAEMLAELSSAYNNRPGVPDGGGLQGAQAGEPSTLKRLYEQHQCLLSRSSIALAVCSALQTALNNRAAAWHSSTIRSFFWPGDSSNQQHPSSSGSLDSPPLVPALLAAVLNFSYSGELCQQLLDAGVLAQLTQLLQLAASKEAAGPADKLTVQVVEVLWNVLQLAPNKAHSVLSQGSASQSTQQAAPTRFADSMVTEPIIEEAVAAHDSGNNLATGSSVSSAVGSWGATVSGQEVGHHSSAAAETASSSTPAVAASSNTEPVATKIAQQLLEALAALFCCQLQDTSGRQVKEQRNDTLAVLHHLSNIPSCCAALGNSSLFAIILAIATTPELQPSSQHIPQGALTRDEPDLEMKLLIWGIIGNTAARSAAFRAAATAAGFLRVLLLVVEESAARGCFAVGRWSPEQLVTLRKLAWAVLLQVAPLCKPDFLSGKGVAVLLCHLSSCTSADSSATSTSNNYIGASSGSLQAPFGRTSSNRNLSGATMGLKSALRLLQRVVAHDAAMAEVFAGQGVVLLLLQLLQSPAAAGSAEVKQGVLLALSELCAAGGKKCLVALRQADGVGLLLKECEDLLESDPALPSLPGLAALDCLWRCCLPSARSRAQLLAVDGMDVLLGLLYKGNKYMRPVILSILADLLSDQRSHPFFHEWHAPVPPTMQSNANNSIVSSTISSTNSSSKRPRLNVIIASQLLIAIWREQDAARGMSGPDGLLANPVRPLAGAGGPSKWDVRDAGVMAGYGLLKEERKALLQRIAGASNPDLLLDKVYACFAELGFETVLSALGPDDAATLQFIRQYVKFRQGEVWQDIHQEFAAEGVNPTQDDRVRIASGIEHSELIAQQVREAQRALLTAAAGDKLAAERALYDAMAAQAAADAQAKVYQKDHSKLTMKERLAVKAKKEEMLKHSIMSSTAAAQATAFHPGGATASMAGQAAGSSMQQAVGAAQEDQQEPYLDE